jgi:hypothetical protein
MIFRKALGLDGRCNHAEVMLSFPMRYLAFEGLALVLACSTVADNQSQQF